MKSIPRCPPASAIASTRISTAQVVVPVMHGFVIPSLSSGASHTGDMQCPTHP